MNKRHAVIIVSSVAIIGTLLVFVISQANEQHLPEPERVDLSTIVQQHKIQQAVDQYSKEMADLRNRVQKENVNDLNSGDELADEYLNASTTLARNAINELRKTDPEAARKIESDLQKMLQTNNNR